MSACGADDGDGFDGGAVEGERLSSFWSSDGGLLGELRAVSKPASTSTTALRMGLSTMPAGELGGEDAADVVVELGLGILPDLTACL